MNEIKKEDWIEGLQFKAAEMHEDFMDRQFPVADVGETFEVELIVDQRAHARGLDSNQVIYFDLGSAFSEYAELVRRVIVV